jgi:sugar transferase EpsL
MYRRYIKQPLDTALAAAALVALAPILFTTALIVRFTMGSPIFFRQPRPGRHSVPFEVLKFRTMREAEGQTDATRLTSSGRRLRSLSLDELPTLVNVLKGDMSIVGPRPLLVSYLNRYTPQQARRHEVKPGITGLAQVSGRNVLSWEEKFRLDVWYVDHCSFVLDLKILARTVLKLVTRDGINQPGHATAAEFMGTPQP